MARTGRPIETTRSRIAAAGARMGFGSLSMKAVARELGTSEMTIYRHAGNARGLHRLVVEHLLVDHDFPRASGTDPVADLRGLARDLVAFVSAHPGIGRFVFTLDATDADLIEQLDRVQTSYADAYGWAPARASWIVSSVAQLAVSLTEMMRPDDDTSVPTRCDPGRDTLDAPTVLAGAAAAAGLSAGDRIDWVVECFVDGALRHPRPDGG